MERPARSHLINNSIDGLDRNDRRIGRKDQLVLAASNIFVLDEVSDMPVRDPERSKSGAISRQNRN